MAYNEKLAGRIRESLGNVPFVEKKMFGGVGFLIHGNMACGAYKESMIVRVDPAKHAVYAQEAGRARFRHHREADERLADG